MHPVRIGARLACLSFGLLALECPAAERFPEPLPSDTELRTESLPARYPPSWALFAYSNDKFELRNVGGDDLAVKGQLPGYESPTILVGSKRPELYIADTMWSRGNRGVRTDYITVYDKSTLRATGEIVLPGAKRALVVPMHGMFAFADDERLGLVFNFTPSASVTVVDLVQRKVLSEIPTPGCTLAFSTGQRGFSTLCASGTMLSVSLDPHGKVARRTESKPFNAVDADALFTESALIGAVRYFPSLQGRMQPVDMSGEAAAILPDWPLVGAEDRARSWRPSGLQLVASGADGRLYVIMQPDAHEGTHKKPGTEVWVFDPATRTRVDRLRLVRPGSSIQITRAAQPELLVATADRVDVYDLPRGVLVRSLDAENTRGGMLLETVQ